MLNEIKHQKTFNSKLKYFVFVCLLAFLITLPDNYAQGLGELAPPKPLEVFPANAWGMDIMFGDAGFGLGTFFRKQLDDKWTAFADLSFSETKDDREFEYYDYYTGTFVTISKKNRIFQVPVNFGVQYRLFENTISDNLRPFICAGAGPSILITTPYELEFFDSFGKAQTKFAAGGYIGLGANIGLDKSSLVGLTFKYYYSKILKGGVESLYGKEKSEIQGFFITLNLGLMY